MCTEGQINRAQGKGEVFNCNGKNSVLSVLSEAIFLKTSFVVTHKNRPLAGYWNWDIVLQVKESLQ